MTEKFAKYFTFNCFFIQRFTEQLKSRLGVKNIFKSSEMNILLVMLFFLFSSAIEVFGLSYDYSFTPECLETPLEPQYEGGMVVNPEISDGLKGWSTFGTAKLATRESKDGNKFIVAFDRNVSHHSFSQKFDLDHHKLYTVSAWLQVSHGESEVAAVFKTSTGYVHAGWAIAQSRCWSMLKGGLVLNASGPAELYFHTENPTVELWADSISLQGFTEDEWKSHQDESVEKTRKSKVRIQTVDSQGRPLANATVSIKQQKRNFPFGCAINKNILNNRGYQNWFSSRFKYTVFENEMKWYSTEPSSGKEDYSVPDAMLKFVKQRNVVVRGHNVFWDDPNFNPSWVRQLPSGQLRQAVDRRINSIVRRYAGQLIHWDVVNENMHFAFLEQKLGATVSATLYKQANAIDGRATPFLNEYNTIEEPGDKASSPSQYIRKVRQIREGYGGPLGIGLEGHFGAPNLAYVRSAIDALASQRLPIWITELDVSSRPNQDKFLDQILRETHGHPAVNGILIWAAWSPQGCYRMCLTDNNFRNLATGNVIDSFLKELAHEGLEVTTDADGLFTALLYHGDYEVEISHSTAANSTVSRRFRVTPTNKEKTLKISLNKLP